MVACAARLAGTDHYGTDRGDGGRNRLPAKHKARSRRPASERARSTDRGRPLIAGEVISRSAVLGQTVAPMPSSTGSRALVRSRSLASPADAGAIRPGARVTVTAPGGSSGAPASSPAPRSRHCLFQRQPRSTTGAAGGARRRTVSAAVELGERRGWPSIRRVNDGRTDGRWQDGSVRAHVARLLRRCR